ncbi:uncharacterized protein PSFLO_04442 [Pseudozyma flocculosa]|uniref:Uncharacterized protein n=1 Tax=Pseudozyma flocculosa TaxID=84751 RepID=A0A5C3F372_9BASI|nr:uncharacterized protein PSFLO_04442 [Pseudozyma flocculosa]
MLRVQSMQTPTPGSCQDFHHACCSTGSPAAAALLLAAAAAAGCVHQSAINLVRASMSGGGSPQHLLCHDMVLAPAEIMQTSRCGFKTFVSADIKEDLLKLLENTTHKTRVVIAELTLPLDLVNAALDTGAWTCFSWSYDKDALQDEDSRPWQFCALFKKDAMLFVVPTVAMGSAFYHPLANLAISTEFSISVLMALFLARSPPTDGGYKLPTNMSSVLVHGKEAVRDCWTAFSTISLLTLKVDGVLANPDVWHKLPSWKAWLTWFNGKDGFTREGDEKMICLPYCHDGKEEVVHIRHHNLGKVLYWPCGQLALVAHHADNTPSPVPSLFLIGRTEEGATSFQELYQWSPEQLHSLDRGLLFALFIHEGFCTQQERVITFTVNIKESKGLIAKQLCLYIKPSDALAEDAAIKKPEAGLWLTTDIANGEVPPAGCTRTGFLTFTSRAVGLFLLPRGHTVSNSTTVTQACSDGKLLLELSLLLLRYKKGTAGGWWHFLGALLEKEDVPEWVRARLDEVDGMAEELATYSKKMRNKGINKLGLDKMAAATEAGGIKRRLSKMKKRNLVELMTWEAGHCPPPACCAMFEICKGLGFG